MSTDVAEKCEAIRQRMEEYNPGNGVTNIMILLMGMLGHGKSSLINSCLCVTENKTYYNEAGSGDSAGPITMKTKKYKLRGPVSIIDNRGLNKLNVEELNEIRFQYSQLRRLGEVQWNRALDEVFDLFSTRVTNPPTEFYVPVFVYSVQCVLTKQMYKDIEPFIRNVQVITGVFPIIVLTRSTHTDGTQDAETLINAFRRLGANYIIPIENYTTENPIRNNTTDTAVMKFLDVCLDAAQHAISRREDCTKDEFLNNAIEQIKKNVNHEISKRDDKIEELEKEIAKFKEKCNLM